MPHHGQPEERQCDSKKDLISESYHDNLCKSSEEGNNHWQESFSSRSSQFCFQFFIYYFLFTAFFNSFIYVQSSSSGILNTQISLVNDMFCWEFPLIIIYISILFIVKRGVTFYSNADEVFISSLGEPYGLLRPPNIWYSFSFFLE